MGKKKGKGNGSNDADVPEAVEEQPTATVRADSPQQEHQRTAVEDMSVEELREELTQARAEVARLKAELAKSQERDTPIKGSKPQDVQELQDKLQRLRKEQQEADAARDKAWKQLKAVVQEISSLANPDYLQSLQVKSHE